MPNPILRDCVGVVLEVGDIVAAPIKLSQYGLFATFPAEIVSLGKKMATVKIRPDFYGQRTFDRNVQNRLNSGRVESMTHRVLSEKCALLVHLSDETQENQKEKGVTIEF